MLYSTSQNCCIHILLIMQHSNNNIDLFKSVKTKQIERKFLCQSSNGNDSISDRLGHPGTQQC